MKNTTLHVKVYLLLTFFFKKLNCKYVNDQTNLNVGMFMQCGSSSPITGPNTKTNDTIKYCWKHNNTTNRKFKSDTMNTERGHSDNSFSHKVW